jgi:hypothetical protein
MQWIEALCLMCPFLLLRSTAPAETWDVQERDGCCEVGTGQGHNYWKEEEEDDDDDDDDDEDDGYDNDGDGDDDDDNGGDDYDFQNMKLES